MNKYWLSLSALLMIGLAVELALAQIPPPSSANGDSAAVQELPSAMRGWVQVNSDGFGEQETVGVTVLEAFHGQLYAGVTNWQSGGRVWRMDDGTSWAPASEIGFGSVQASVDPAVIHMIVFNGQLYAGTGWGAGRGQIWRSSDGTNWEQVAGDGFGDAANRGIAPFTVFSDTLYVATGNITYGLQIWRSSTGDSLSWTNVVTGGFGYPTTVQVTGFSEFGSALYAATEAADASANAQIWRTSDGLAWTPVITDGFGDPGNYSAGGFALFGGDLYLGTRNDATGAQLWRSSDGATWSQVLGDGFGDSSNVKIESLYVFEGRLYAVTYNRVSGMEVWRSADGTTWRQVNPDGFGDSNNWATLWSNATLSFGDRLFIGTWNDVRGGEIWMALRQVSLPLVLRDYQHGSSPPPPGPTVSRPRFQVFILNPVRTCLVGNDFASGSVCRGPNCGDCDCTWEEFDPPAPMVGVSPDRVNDPQYAEYDYRECVTITLSSQEVADIIADMQLVRDQVLEWSGGTLDLQMQYTVLPHDHVGFVAPDYVFGPFEVDDELLHPYVTTTTDFVYVVNGVYDRAQGLHLAYWCGSSYGEMSVHGAGYANVQYNDLCNSVKIAGQSVYEPLIHEWMHNLDWALYYINLVPDIYQGAWPDWEHWDPGSWPACGTGASDTYSWFPSVDLCEWDPDWIDCNNEASARACLHAGEVDGGISWYEHVISAHYPRTVQFLGNHCRDGRQDFGETGIDQGWPCPEN